MLLLLVIDVENVIISISTV